MSRDKEDEEATRTGALVDRLINLTGREDIYVAIAAAAGLYAWAVHHLVNERGVPEEKARATMETATTNFLEIYAINHAGRVMN